MQLKLASINFWGLAWPWTMHKQKRLNSLVEFVKKENFDIVCLQEIWRSKDAKKILSGLSEYNYYIEAKRMKNPSGLVILSKFPLGEGSYLPFGTVDYEEVVFRKGMLIADCIFPSGESVRIINTHLYTTLRPLNSRIWSRQIAELYSALNNNRTIVFGDFNYHYPNFPFPELNILTPTECATRNTENYYNKKMFNRFSRVNMVCDLILANFEAMIISNEIVKEPLISDHYPVSALIEL